MNQRKISIEDTAQKAAVSSATVSRMFSCVAGAHVSEQPIEQMGEEVACMMIEKLMGGKKRGRAVRRITYEGRLVLRGSERYPENKR